MSTDLYKEASEFFSKIGISEESACRLVDILAPEYMGASTMVKLAEDEEKAPEEGEATDDTSDDNDISLTDGLTDGSRNWLTSWGATAGVGLLGATAAGLLTHMQPERPGETPEERRNRILRNAAIAGIAGAGAHRLGSMAYDSISKPDTRQELTPMEKALQSDYFHGAGIGVGGAAGYAIGSRGNKQERNLRLLNAASTLNENLTTVRDGHLKELTNLQSSKASLTKQLTAAAGNKTLEASLIKQIQDVDDVIKATDLKLRDINNGLSSLPSGVRDPNWRSLSAEQRALMGEGVDLKQVSRLSKAHLDPTTAKRIMKSTKLPWRTKAKGAGGAAAGMLAGWLATTGAEYLGVSPDRAKESDVDILSNDGYFKNDTVFDGYNIKGNN